MSQSTPTYVGLDVSKQSINVAIQRPDGTLDEDRVANTLDRARKLAGLFRADELMSRRVENRAELRRILRPTENGPIRGRRQ